MRYHLCDAEGIPARTATEVKATVEILSGIVRVGPHHEKYGDPFDGSVTFSSVDGKTVVFKGLAKNSVEAIDTPRYRAIVRALARLGLGVRWDRIKVNDGTKTKRTVKPRKTSGKPRKQ